MRELPLVGDEFAGYRLLAALGRGGMSTVYRAENPRLGNVIALKLMAPELAEDDVFRARFLEESRIAAGLNHPNVIPIHDSGSSDGHLYIAMRYVTGTDLRQMLKKRGRLPPEMAVGLLSQAARALDAAHRRGLVHRDVKPGNLLVEQASDDADPDHVYLTDFGITKHADEHSGLTATGHFIGTVDYIAPEQIRGLSVLGMADQYSLGCVLYECLTGRVPFERDMNAAIIWAHVEDQPTQPSLVRPDLPPAVDAVFARVLAKQPGDRYGSCREFMTAAREALTTPAEGPGTGGALQAAPLEPMPDPFRSGSPAHDFPPFQRYPAGPPAAEPPLQRARPAELAHERAGVHEEVTRSVPKLPVWGDAAAVGADGAGILAPRADPPGGSQPGGRPRPVPRGGRRGSGRTAGLLALYAVIVLSLAAGVGVALIKFKDGGNSKVTLSGNGATASAAAGGGASMGASMGASSGDAGPAALAGVLEAANTSVEGKGLFPAANCGHYQPNSSGAIVCTSPAAGIAEVTYQQYSSLSALYDAYRSQVTALDGGTFNENTGTCGDSPVSYAEFGWNHEEGHPHNFTVAQMASGQVGQMFAMGRMACFATQTPHGTSQDIVWTIDNGLALAVAVGNGSPAQVYQYWAALHHTVLFRGTEMCGSAGRMDMADIPTGNLKNVPVCPAGVEGS